MKRLQYNEDAASGGEDKFLQLIEELIKGSLEMQGFYKYLCDADPDMSIEDRWEYLSRIQALRAAMTLDGVVKFSYGGEAATIIAYGTRCASILRHYPHSRLRKRKEPGADGSFPYYNLEKECWCCFDILKFISTDSDYQI